MKLSHLMAFLRGHGGASVLTKRIEREVRTVAERRKTRGLTLPIILEKDMEDLPQIVGFPEVRTLCLAYLNGELTSHEVEYIADAIQLAEYVEYADPRIADMVFLMSDPVVNGPFEAADAREMVAEIDRASNTAVEADRNA